MCYSLRFLVILILLATPRVGMAQRAYSNIGRTPSQEEIQSLGVIVDPLGKNLPAGKGTAKEGAELYAKQCAACHGKNGEGGVADRLVMGSPGNPHRGPDTDQDPHQLMVAGAAQHHTVRHAPFPTDRESTRPNS